MIGLQESGDVWVFGRDVQVRNEVMVNNGACMCTGHMKLCSTFIGNFVCILAAH